MTRLKFLSRYYIHLLSCPPLCLTSGSGNRIIILLDDKTHTAVSKGLRVGEIGGICPFVMGNK